MSARSSLARNGRRGVRAEPLPRRAEEPLNNARQRYVTAEEAARLVTAADASRNPQLAEIVQLPLDTGKGVSKLLSTQGYSHLANSTLLATVEVGATEQVQPT